VPRHALASPAVHRNRAFTSHFPASPPATASACRGTRTPPTARPVRPHGGGHRVEAIDPLRRRQQRHAESPRHPPRRRRYSTTRRRARPERSVFGTEIRKGLYDAKRAVTCELEPGEASLPPRKLMHAPAPTPATAAAAATPCATSRPAALRPRTPRLAATSSTSPRQGPRRQRLRRPVEAGAGTAGQPRGLFPHRGTSRPPWCASWARRTQGPTSVGFFLARPICCDSYVSTRDAPTRRQPRAAEQWTWVRRPQLGSGPRPRRLTGTE